MQEVLERRCRQCGSGVLVRATVRSGLEALAFLVGSDIRRCHFREARFICFRQFSMRSRAKMNDDTGLMTVWLAIRGGVMACLGIGLWTLRRFHRWPF